MNNESKIYLAAFSGLVVAILLVAWGVFAIRSEMSRIYIPGSAQNIGATGDVNATSRIAQSAFSTASSTAFSALNNSGRDRIISNTNMEMQGFTAASGWGFASGTLAAINLRCATSTNTGFPTNTNYVYSSSIPTTSPFLYAASTSPGSVANTASNRIWASNSYLVCRFQDNFSTPTTTPTAAKGYLNVNYDLDM